MTRDIVTFMIAGQIFGADVRTVHDVFKPDEITPVPLARKDVAGLINLRGRIVTLIDARTRLSLPARTRGEMMVIGFERGGDSYGLIVDKVGDVLRLEENEFEPAPAHLDDAWRDVLAGIVRRPDQLLVVLDIDRMLEPAPQAQAA